MRIISGRWGGHRLSTPKGNTTRPTSDRVREALFSILGDLTDERFLDLFAGTGANGMEALSRGAQLAVFVEKNRNALETIKKNIQSLKISPEYFQIKSKDVLLTIEQLIKQEMTFNVVFADPPWAEANTYGPKIAKIVGQILEKHGLFVLENRAKSLAPQADMLSFVETRTYGDTCLHIFEKL